MVAVPYPIIADGTRVRTTGSNPNFENGLPGSMRAERKWGVYGKIDRYYGAITLYDVRHDDGSDASYENSEFEVLEVQACDLNPLRLTTAGWWQELEKLRTTYGLPTPLVDCMKSLVSAHLTSTIPPEATSNLVQLAKEHLRGGILLSDSACDTLYEIMAWVPDRGKEEEKMSHFRLVPAWPDGKLHHLADL